MGSVAYPRILIFIYFYYPIISSHCSSNLSMARSSIFNLLYSYLLLFIAYLHLNHLDCPIIQEVSPHLMFVLGHIEVMVTSTNHP